MADPVSVKKEIEERFLRNSQLERMGVQITVDHSGAVTLSGESPGQWNKRLAEDVALAVAGVSTVRNELQIAPPQPRLRRLRRQKITI